MTREQLKAKFPNISEYVLAHSSVPGGLESPQRKPNPLPTLGSRPQIKPGRKRGVVIVVTFIALRNRELDSDNLVSGFKKLRDCVATSLGVDDGDKRIRWEYGFAKTSGREQVLVRIQRIK